MNELPFLSIIIPLYNKEQTIKRTLNKLLEQPFSDFELILVDDGSTDNSVDIVYNIHDERIKLYKKSNGGPSSARNLGMDKAIGKYGYFIDADDLIVDNGLQTIADTIASSPGFDLYVFNYYIIRANQKLIFSKYQRNGAVCSPFIQHLLRNIHLCPGSVAFDMKSISKLRFNNDLHRREDSEFFFNAMRNHSIYSSTTPIFEYNNDTLCASLPRKDWYEDFICQMEPSGKSFFEQLCLYQLYIEAQNLYPNYIHQIYGNTFTKLQYRIAYSLFMRYLTYRWKKNLDKEKSTGD